jgi:hypothetical protein
MKKLLSIFTALSLCLGSTSQTPQKLSYQSVVRDAANQLVTNQPVGLKISILQGAIPVFEETHSVTTTNFGVVSVEVGSGTLLSGSISGIDWSAGSYTVKTETDPGGGTIYSISGTTQLISVPYVLYSETAESFISGDYNDLTNTPAALDGSETRLSAGTDISITGNGTTATPYIINASPGAGNFTHYIGELYQGGIIVALWKESGVEKGIIASLINVGFVPWSNLTTTLIGASAQSIRNGQANTTAIITQPGHITSAALLCNDYTNVNTGTGVYTDWYLPAIWELEQCFNSAFVVNKVIGDANGFIGEFYYSSTESANNTAWGISFITCYALNTGVKANPSRVRAIRRF